MKNLTRKKKNESGQSTVEFALTLVLLLSFVMFYIQLALVFSFGNYVHYATFMSARAFYAAGPDRDDQSKRARDVIVQMLKKSGGQAGVDKFPSIARGTGGSDPGGFEVGGLDRYEEASRDSSWMRGVRYTFRSRLFLIPFGRGNKQAAGGDSVNSLTLTSESFLGAEPATYECVESMSKMKGLFDNGC
jgi:hypothetical protein